MFENKFNTKKTDPLVEAVMQAQQDGEMRRQAEAIVNEAFGVYNRNALVREDLAEYDAAIEEVYADLKEGTWTGVKLKSKKVDSKHGDVKAKDVTYKSPRMKKRETIGTIDNHHRGEWGTDDEPGLGSKDAAVDSVRTGAAYDRWKDRAQKRGYNMKKYKFEEAKLADKDYDKDGKIESPKDEVWGSRLRAAKMAGKLKEEEQIDEISRGLALKASRAADKRASEIHRADGGKWVGSGEFKSIPGQHYSAGLAQQAVKHYNKKSEKFKAYANKKTPDFEHNVETLKKYASPAVVRKLAKEETDYSAQDRAPVTKSAPKEDPSTPKSYPGAASTVSGPNPTSQRMSNAVKPKLQEAVSRKHFQQVADLIKGHDSQEKRNELASHHAGIFAKQNPRFNAAKFHAAAGSTAHQEPKKMDEAKYSYKSARRGEDIGKPGKMFGKIAKKAGERYGSEERGKKVAGAILAKIRAKHMKEDSLNEAPIIPASKLKPGQSLRDYMNAEKGLTRRDNTSARPSSAPTGAPGLKGPSGDAFSKTAMQSSQRWADPGQRDYSTSNQGTVKTPSTPAAAPEKTATWHAPMSRPPQEIASKVADVNTGAPKVAQGPTAPSTTATAAPAAPKNKEAGAVPKTVAESVQVGGNNYRIV